MFGMRGNLFDVSTRIRKVFAFIIGYSQEDSKYSFGQLNDLACAEPVTVAKHGHPVVVVMAVKEFERLKALDRRPSGTAGEKGARANDC